jgi:molybdate-binding protein/DNA-binding XRE family transcriptional regulator
MTESRQPGNRVRELRQAAGLTQAGLAERAGISRTAVTAIEAERLVPSVAAALSLAGVLGATVEVLFASRESASEPAWACTPRLPSGGFWRAEVQGQNWLYPADAIPMLTPLPDGLPPETTLLSSKTTGDPRQTLVIACCDPAAGLLASEYSRATGQRLLVLHRSSRQALELLKEGKVHAAGLHFSTADEPERNGQIARETLGDGYLLVRVADWQEGIAAAPGSRVRSVRGALQGKLHWVGREPGSGARQCLDRLLGDRSKPRHLARHHRGVAEAVQCGWADAGVCLQLTSAEAGLDFFPVEIEAYDLCVPRSVLDDPRLQALVNVLRSSAYRRWLAQLPGYDTSHTGELLDAT